MSIRSDVWLWLIKWVSEYMKLWGWMNEWRSSCVIEWRSHLICVWISKWFDNCKLSFVNGNDCVFRLVGGLIYWLVGWLWEWVGEREREREREREKRERWGGWVGGCEWASEQAREGGKYTAKDWGKEGCWCTGAKNDHFINVRLSLDRVLTTQLGWF